VWHCPGHRTSCQARARAGRLPVDNVTARRRGLWTTARRVEGCGMVRRPPRRIVPPRRGAGYRNELISMVSVRPGPTPIAEIGAPDISSSARTYACAFFGRSEKVLAPEMSSSQPGSVS
jgi:hypothetical protein